MCSMILVVAILQVNAKEYVVSQVSGTHHSLDNSVAKFFDRTLKPGHLHWEDLEKTTFGKPSHIPLASTRMSSKATPVLHSPALQQQEQKDVIAKEGLSSFFKTLDAVSWDMLQGRRERRWNPDRRPESQRGERAGPGEGSQLSWGGQISGLHMNFMARQQHAAYAERSNAQLRNLPLGSAATALFGESAKGDDELDVEVLAGLEKLIRNTKIGDEGKIDGPVALAELIMRKYGKYYDVAVVRNSRQVAFNIYDSYLGQASFAYTEDQYLQKLESILSLLDAVGQTWYIKEFLTSPIKSRRGLPSTPQSDTAVTVCLNQSPTWDDSRDQDIVQLWFTPGLQ